MQGIKIDLLTNKDYEGYEETVIKIYNKRVLFKEKEIKKVESYRVPGCKVLEKVGWGCSGTDLLKLTGGSAHDEFFSCYDKSSRGLVYITVNKDYVSNENFSAINFYFNCSNRGYDYVINWDYKQFSTYGAIRPVLYVSDEMFEKIRNMPKYNDPCSEYIEFGYYPQFKIRKDIIEKLNHESNNNLLRKTGYKYMINHKYNEEYNYEFVPNYYDEYEYEGKKFIYYKDAWIEVSPVEWYIDYENKRLICKRALIAGVPFLNPNEKYTTFENTIMYKFLNEYLLHDLLQHEQLVKTDNEVITDIIEEEKKEIPVLEKLKSKKEILDEIKRLSELLYKNQENTNSFIDVLQFKDDHSEFKRDCLPYLKNMDLSNLSMRDVKASNIDFTDTNLYIDPQKVYKKDLSNAIFNNLPIIFGASSDFHGVNIRGCKFSYNFQNELDKILFLNRLLKANYDENTVFNGDFLENYCNIIYELRLK